MEIDNIQIEKTLDDLIVLIGEDIKLFHKTYKTLPIELYSEIERLSMSKSSVFLSLCNKAKLVAETFHKNIN